MITPEYSILLKKKTAGAVAAGYPWIFGNDVEMNSALELAPPGAPARFCDTRGRPLAIGYINPSSVLFGRVLTMQPKETIDAAFFHRRFERALGKREELFDVPYYRLIHSEGDGLPGLIVDRFDDLWVCQTGTAGMEQLKPLWIDALASLFSPRAILFRDDTSARRKEGLPLSVSARGEMPAMPVAVLEHQTCYFADLLEGQKTGWFYDQRANRRLVAKHCGGKTVLDLYSHSGGFGLAAAAAGASSVTMVDASALALQLSRRAADRNRVADRCEWIEGDIFELLPRWAAETRVYDVVVADPPAFIKERKHKMSGLKGYEKLARLCAPMVKPGGHMFIASCSHHASPPEFRRAVEAGLNHSGRSFRHLSATGADQDHPPHPQLAENAYLKGLLYIFTG